VVDDEGDTFFSHLIVVAWHFVSEHFCILFIIMLYFTEDSFVLQVDKNILYDIDKNSISFLNDSCTNR